jgi:RHS repeat-associated protein
VVLSETTGTNTTRYVHGLRGIHAQKDSGGTWDYMLQDGLGSVRSVVDNAATILDSRNYDPYGNPFSVVGTTQTGYGFTGELLDGGGLLDLRARNYQPGLGVFASLDPFEGLEDEPMSLNGYSYVHGNPVNWTDPSGEFPWLIPLAIVGAIGLATAATIAYYSYLNANSCSSLNPQACSDAQDILDLIDSAADSVGQACTLTTQVIVTLLSQSESTSTTRVETQAIPRVREREDEDDDCNARRGDPRTSAFTYADIAKTAYWDAAAAGSPQTEGRSPTTPLIVALTWAKSPNGDCHEYVAISNAGGERYNANRIAKWRIGRDIISGIAASRQATLFGNTPDPITYLYGSAGHAESNLINGVGAGNMDAMGVTAAPCGLGQDSLESFPTTCTFWLRNTHPGIAVAYFSNLRGSVQMWY